MRRSADATEWRVEENPSFNSNVAAISAEAISAIRRRTMPRFTHCAEMCYKRFSRVVALGSGESKLFVFPLLV
jgi:hypothetical protein